MGQGSKHEGVERYEGPEGVTWTARASKRLLSGKRVYWRDTFTTERAAVIARRAWLAHQDGASAIEPNRDTLANAVTTWLETYPQTKAPKTALEYRRIVKNHILPSPLMHLPLQKLNAGHIQDWYNGLSVGARTKELIHLRLCQILDMAVAHKRIRENPARECSVPKSVPRRGTLLRPEQVAAFLTVAREDFFSPLWDVAVATGFRRGEVLGLRWRDLDLARGLLAVSHSVIWLDKPSPQERVKTEASYRTIRIPADVAALLAAHADQQAVIRARAGDAWEDKDLVFCTRHGRPLSPNNMHKHFKELLARAGLPGTVKIHDLRHTNLSHLLNNGVPITTVARRGGYRNPNVLLSIYAHADAEQDAIAADVVSALTQVGQSSTDKSE